MVKDLKHMPDFRKNALAYAHEQHNRFVNELIEILHYPSVSTDPDQRPEMQQTASWLSDHLKKIGVENVHIYQTPGHPVVYGDWLNAGNSKPVILVYGHYDVQPPEPLDLWKSDPFKPEIRDGSLFARGASDMKGQVIASLSAVESAIHSGGLGVNLKFIFEGEEEIGSPSLGKFLDEHKDLLASDLALNPDAGMISPDSPSIVYALRGMAYFELRVYGPEHDLHSGIFGGVVHNPAQAICELIAGMHDSQGRITLPGYYDKVVTLSPEEKIEFARLPMNDDFYLRQTGIPQIWGEAGYSPVERIGIRPTLEINGLSSGFTGKGTKTVIPSWAMAKISMRLVPNQDPEEVHQQLLRYLQEHAPQSIRWELTAYGGGPAAISDRNSPGAQALSHALETVWGTRPLYKREGGSIPVVVEMQKTLGIDSVLTGFGLPDDNAHAPNEKLHLETWSRGIDALIHFLYNMS